MHVNNGWWCTGLAEDYAEIVDEEGDYSSPAKDYELDRGKIELSEIIGKDYFEPYVTQRLLYFMACEPT